MADLEHLLLEAAGRTRPSGGRRQSRQKLRQARSEAYSDDDGSDSGDDVDSDDQGFARRKKTSGSQFSLKKRFDPPERDGDDDDNDRDGGGRSDSDSGISVGSDLYKDDEDREKLSKMSELERELILTERGDKRNDYWIKKKARDSTIAGKRTPPRISRSSVKSNKMTPKDDALNELRAKRMKQHDLGNGLDAITGSGLYRHSSPREWKDRSDSSSSENGSRKYNNQIEEDNELLDSDDDDDSTSIGVTFDEIKGITIRRSKLAKWIMEPFFDELIVGCYVRVGIGLTKSGQSIYRLCMVKNVDATDPDRRYKLENKTTYKFLNCVWGCEASAARWQMARVSDSLPCVDEFTALIHEVEREGGGLMPRREAVLEKMEAIKQANNFVYSAATVKQMLQEKKNRCVSSKPLNVAAEKDRLRKEMEVAESHGDKMEMERISKRQKELVEMSRQIKYKDEKAVRLEAMNRKNREENFKNALQIKPANTCLNPGQDGYDPFSRRWTRSTNYYISKPGVAVDGDRSSNKQGGGAMNGEIATAAALEAAAGVGKLIDTNAPVDRGTEANTLHDFELPISLGLLQKFGGAEGVHAGFIARKQKIEAAVGCGVPDNDSKRHTLTLTVSDYKRRRGLL